MIMEHMEQLLQNSKRIAIRLRLNVLNSPFVRDVVVLTLANGVTAVLSFVQGVLVARWLGPELYGVAALIMSVPSLVYTLFDARSAEASVKYLSEFHARGEREQVLAMCKLGYVVDSAIAALAFLVVAVSAGWAAANIVQRADLVPLIIVYAAAFLPRALVGTSYAVLATLGRFSLISLIDTLASVLRIGLVLGLVMAGGQVAGVVWGNALAMVATGLLYGAAGYALSRRTWNGSWLRGDWRTLKGRRREIAAFLAYNDLNALLGVIPKQLDVVILGYFRNPTEVGYYKLAKSLTGVVAYVVGPLQSVVYPELARFWGVGDTVALWRKVRKLALQVGLPLASATLAGVALIPLVLPMLVGETYRQAVPAAQLLMVGSAVWLGLFWLRPVFFAQGRLGVWTRISAIVVVLSVVGLLTIVPRWGYLGLSVWLMLMNMLGHAIGLWLIRWGLDNNG